MEIRRHLAFCRAFRLCTHVLGVVFRGVKFVNHVLPVCVLSLNVLNGHGRAHAVFVGGGTVPAAVLDGASHSFELSRALAVLVSVGAVGALVVGALYGLTAHAVIAGVFGEGLDLEGFFDTDRADANSERSKGESFVHVKQNK